MTNRRHSFASRLAARRAIALLTGSHASFGLADRMSKFEGYQTVPTMQEARDMVKAYRARHPEIAKNLKGPK